MRILFYLIFAFSFSNIYSQPNCEAFKYYFKDTLKYEACIKAEEIAGYYQFSKEYQEILDESIKIDSTFAYAYEQKSTAYLKSGDFITWRRLMDKAVKYNPQDNLEYRGLMLFKCFRDYRGALKDFQKLDSLGFPTNHLGMTRALCYKSIGQKEKAIQILETQMNREDYSIGLYDYLHLGVIYLEQKAYEKAKNAFLIQNKENNLAENQFYFALTYKAIKMQPEYIEHLKEAKKLYLKGNRMSDFYIDLMHKIYLEDIENEIKSFHQKSSQ